MAKDRLSVNPATAQLKADKARALKKSKAQPAAQRAERLSHRNPERLQNQIDELKAEQEASGGKLKPRDKEKLEGLERDVRLVRKAREASGVESRRSAQPQRENQDTDRRADGGRSGDGSNTGRSGGHGGSALGKRRRSPSAYREATPESATDEDVRSIPMPRDTPPPIPAPQYRHGQSFSRASFQPSRDKNNANNTPMGTARDLGTRTSEMVHAPPQKPQVAQTTYSSAPQVRDLRKEATARFVPAAVVQRWKQKKGEGGRLLEPEEADRLESNGYVDGIVAGAAGKDTTAKATTEQDTGNRQAERLDFGLSNVRRNLEEEEAAFQRELRETEGDLDQYYDKNEVLGVRGIHPADDGVERSEFIKLRRPDDNEGVEESEYIKV